MTAVWYDLVGLQLLEDIIGVAFQEVDLVQSESELFLPFNHLLLEPFESQSWYLGTYTLGVIEQLLELSALDLLLGLGDANLIKVAEVVIKLLHGFIIIELVGFGCEQSSFVEVARYAIELVL